MIISRYGANMFTCRVNYCIIRGGGENNIVTFVATIV